MSSSSSSSSSRDVKGKGRASAVETEAEQVMNGSGSGTSRGGSSGSNSMKARLAEWRSSQRSSSSSSGSGSNGPQRAPRVSEQDLLRDTVLLLQGIDGKHVRFHDPNQLKRDSIRRNKRGLPIHPLDTLTAPDAAGDAEAAQEGGLLFPELDGQPVLPQTTKDLLFKLSELGWLYRKVDSGIQATLSNPKAGMIELSLCHCLKEELRKYDNLIASLETRRASTPCSQEGRRPGLEMHGEPHLEMELDLHRRDLGLTLARIVVWTQECKLRMRMMAVLIEGCATTRGGALLSLLHGYTAHGDPFIRSFTSGLLTQVSLPFFRSLSSWIYEGELVDPGDEFFVQRRPEYDAGSAEESIAIGHEAWHGRYRFRKQMLPTFVVERFGKKIFSTGRSLNYIKYACGDSAWVSQQREDQKSATEDERLQYGDIAGLEHSIDLAYLKASRRLFEIFFEKFGLLRHLRALKDYLLLGRGDFVELLMESLGTSLSKPANTLYRHNLTATLEMAIRGSSSARDHDDVLRRLDARMLEFSHGEIGWDVFVLEYKVDPPVDVVLDAASIEVYTRVFRHLWRIKRVEYALGEAWKRIISEARWYRRVEQLRGDFHQARVTLAEMLHFVRQLQSFSHLEVIDCSWTALEEFALRKEGDLDELVDAHRAYVDRLATKALLRGSGAKSDETLMKYTKQAFEVMLGFKDSLDALCNFALAEASRLDSGQDRFKNMPPSRPPTSAGGSRTATPVPLTPIPPPDPALLAGIRQRLSDHSVHFNELCTSIVQGLATHSDLDLRFLSVRLNFSLFYLTGKKG